MYEKCRARPSCPWNASTFKLGNAQPALTTDTQPTHTHRHGLYTPANGLLTAARCVKLFRCRTSAKYHVISGEKFNAHRAAETCRPSCGQGKREQRDEASLASSLCSRVCRVLFYDERRPHLLAHSRLRMKQREHDSGESVLARSTYWMRGLASVTLWPCRALLRNAATEISPVDGAGQPTAFHQRASSVDDAKTA